MKDLVGYPIDAEDGKIGKVKDFLFDDEKLAVRYMVADTGGWLSNHLVLISPRHLKSPDLGKICNHLPVALTREQVESCPPLALATPISRQYELRYARHYGHRPYWSGSYLWGMQGVPAMILAGTCWLVLFETPPLQPAGHGAAPRDFLRLTSAAFCFSSSRLKIWARAS